MKTARVIITMDCNRSCTLCCNRQEFVQKAARIKSLWAIQEYSSFVFTGGEPLLEPFKLMKAILNTCGFGHPVDCYLQTAYYDTCVYELLTCLRGITYSLHAEGFCNNDMENFRRMERVLLMYPKLSARLWIEDSIKHLVNPREGVWGRITTATKKEDCPAGVDEDLFILE